MANKKSLKAGQRLAAIDMVETMQKTLDQFKATNPDINVDAILSEHIELQSLLKHVQSRELTRFTAYAKEQGTNMPFDDLEMGMLNAGMKDIRNSLGEVLDSLKFEAPVSEEDGANMDNRGRGKKNVNSCRKNNSSSDTI